ncbi:2-amino-4-hydroxy-6-hydroxymethyldihydropteridine diphosphokinase [Methylomonas sp. AM2-LC]|uniref:2-amino-4-hydroxy-6- hydroxymethyldihydropteridine diphosphokinase n=1 Tax=Methylomonas sp. AM2-LC TaxID=3153301 RepID=UPI0032673FF0
MSLSESWNEVFIGLGSNLDNPIQHIQQAISAITQLTTVEFIACSSLYNSLPVGPQDQPNFVNAVLRIKTCLTPQNLLKALQNIENDHGRVRNQHWGARTLDLDILLYGTDIVKEPNLQIPHAEISNRGFVLYPLAEIVAEDLFIPGKAYLSELLTACQADGLWKIQS